MRDALRQVGVVVHFENGVSIYQSRAREEAVFEGFHHVFRSLTVAALLKLNHFPSFATIVAVWEPHALGGILVGLGTGAPRQFDG
jgi:hypothetical protein